MVAHLDVRVRGIVPLLGTIEGRNADTPGNEHIASDFSDLRKRALHAIKDVAEETGTKFDGQRGRGALDGVTNGEAGSLLVDLDDGGVTHKTDDLA